MAISSSIVVPGGSPEPSSLTERFSAWRKKRRNIAAARKNVREKLQACSMFPNEEVLRFELALPEDCLRYLTR